MYWLSNHSVRAKAPYNRRNTKGRLLKERTAGVLKLQQAPRHPPFPIPQLIKTQLLGVGLRICISNKFPGAAHAAGFGPTLWEQEPEQNFDESYLGEGVKIPDENFDFKTGDLWPFCH